MAPRSQVKHSTAEPLRSQIKFVTKIAIKLVVRLAIKLVVGIANYNRCQNSNKIVGI